MSRMIKFRQWNSNNNRFQYNIGVSGPGEWTCPSYCNWETYPLEQFTGLHDRNKKEIYEGDIVRLLRAMNYSGNRGDVGAIEHDPVELGYIVMNGYSLTRLTESRAKNLEVIGNIHENKELLTFPPRVILG